MLGIFKGQGESGRVNAIDSDGSMIRQILILKFEILLESIVIVGCYSEVTGDEFSWEVCIWVIKACFE